MIEKNNKQLKTLILSFGVICMMSTTEARIVHTPREALSGGVNPCVDSRGATWTAAQVKSATDTPSVASLLPSSYSEASQGKGFCMDGGGYPRIAVNDSEGSLWPDANGAELRPGEVFMFPGVNTGKDRAMLTFTVPRDGWYSLDAQFRAIGAANWYSIDTAIRLDGLVLNQDEDIQRTVTPKEGKRVTFVKKRLNKGSQISFVLGPCAYDEQAYGGWWSDNDAAALRVEIVEEDGSEIVHEPTEALSGGTNPGMDAMGGTWTALCCEYGNDLPTVATKLTSAATVVGSSGKGFAKAANEYPVVAVNDTAEDLWPDANGAALKPGEVFLYPAAGGGQRRAMLMFTVPRNGWYSLDAQFRAIGKDAWYHVDTTIAQDGFVVFQEELHVTSRGLKGREFTFNERFLKKGTHLAFTVGPGWFDDKNYGGWQNLSDATALSVRIVERNYDRLPELEADVADLGSTLLEATSATAADGRIADVSGIGVWEIYDASAENKSLDMGGKRAMSEVMPSAVGERGVRFESARSSENLPYLQVCGLTQVGTLRGESSDAQAAGRYWPIDAVAPGEVLVGNYYPAAECGHVGVRFVPNESGVYTMLVKARDVSYGQYSDGVEVSVWIAGVQSVRQLVSVEQSDATKTWMHYQTDPVSLSANMPVDIVISPREWNAYDETGLSIEIVRLPKILDQVGADAFVALKDMSKASEIANPFVSQGATWQLGALGEDGAFELLNTFVSYDNGTAGFAAAGGDPLVLANANETARGTSTDCYFYPGEFLMRPNNVKYSVMRYLVPSSGVYAVRARFRDVERMDWGEGTESMTGVRCYLMADNIYAAGGEVSCDGHTNVSSDNVLLTADRIYRAEGEPIDIVVDSRDNHSELDFTAVRAFIEPTAVQTVASVDFNAPGSSVYSGLGRVGHDGGVWKSLAAKDGADGASCRYLRDDRGGRVGVSVEIRAPAGGCTMASGAGHSLMSDGFVAKGSTDPYSWTVRGLVAGEAYSLYLYGTSTAVFTVNGTDYSPDAPAFKRLEKNVVVIRAIADSDGKVTGSFSGEAGSLFCGMQIEGPRFDQYVPTGLSIMFR